MQEFTAYASNAELPFVSVNNDCFAVVVHTAKKSLPLKLQGRDFAPTGIISKNYRFLAISYPE